MASVCGICDSEFKSGTVTLPCSKCLKRFCLSCPFPVFKGRQGQKEIAASLASSKHVIFLCMSCVDNPVPPPAPADLARVEKRIADLTKSVDELKAITPVQIPVDEYDEENDEDPETPAALFTEVVSGKKKRALKKMDLSTQIREVIEENDNQKRVQEDEEKRKRCIVIRKLPRDDGKTEWSESLQDSVLDIAKLCQIPS
ncbi:MAG: hypothetical protein GY696_20860 [Gammaproteobacteria bacterium]|nr:hypothetical protein [Gammaproteobacteria bacterium]